MKTIVYIHGLNSSSLSFKYIQSQLPPHKAILTQYNSHQSLVRSIADVATQLPQTGRFSIVCHSLGGIIGLLIASSCLNRVDEIVTISTPVGGSKAANILRWMPGHPLVFEDITPTGVYVAKVNSLDLPIPTLNIISTGGHSNFTPEPNDSVVTIASQLALPFGAKIEVDANHFEVLLHDTTVDLIRKHIFTVS